MLPKIKLKGLIPYEKRITNHAFVQPPLPDTLSKNEWGDLENDPEDLTAEELLEYEDELHALIQKAQLPCEEKHGLAIYLDEALSRKVSSIYPNVEEYSGKLWCGVVQ